MYAISDENARPIGPALYVASHPLLAHLAAALTLVTELGFPICLWKPRAAWFFVPAIVLMHVGIGLTMHLDYSAWALTVLILFVPWDALVDRWRIRGAQAPGRDLRELPLRPGTGGRRGTSSLRRQPGL